MNLRAFLIGTGCLACTAFACTTTTAAPDTGFSIDAPIIIPNGIYPPDGDIDAGTDAPFTRDAGTTPTEIAASSNAATAAIVALECECNADEYHFRTVADCVAIRTLPPAVGACERTALEAATGYLEADSCSVGVTSGYVDCVRAARCDSNTLTSCSDFARIEYDECPIGQPADSSAYQNAYRACVTDNVIGAGIACPRSGPSSNGLGRSVFSGTTIGTGDDIRLSCAKREGGSFGGRNSPDVFHRWVAPLSGRYGFDTFGSRFDTVLGIRSSCPIPTDGGMGGGFGRDAARDPAELACNDDDDSSRPSDPLRSVVTLDLAEGTELLIIVDGVRGGPSAGQYQVNITRIGDSVDSGRRDSGLVAPADAGTGTPVDPLTDAAITG